MNEPISDTRSAAVVQIVAAIARERGRHWTAEEDAPATPLDLDSLERAELLLRVEKAFQVRLPDAALAAATIGDVLVALNGGTVRVDRVAARAERNQAPVASAQAARTLVEVLRFHAEQNPDRVHLTWLCDENDERPLRYGELWDAARRTAAQLQAAGVRPGDRVALMLPTGHEYFQAFYAALLLRAAAVPLYPPFRLDRIEEYARRQALLLKHAGVRVLVTCEPLRAAAGLVRGLVPRLRPPVVIDIGAAAPLPITDAPAPEDLALVQYTSGSTSTPKGVTLSHRNLLANIRAIGQAAAFRSEDVMVSWLPLYHDMGLIGSWMCSLYHGMPLVLLSPERFLSHPDRWLWAMHRYRGTVSPNPNFAYELAARLPESATEGLDLSSWRLAMNGAEPVQPATVARFTDRFKAHGFAAQAMYPVYGLAENSLAVTFPPLGREPRVETVDRARFETEGVAVPAENGLSLVSCGVPLPGVEVRIVDDAGRLLPERRQGRVEFRSPSTIRGYLNHPEATQAVMRSDGWLDSGDLGFLVDGELVLSGRARDLIIRGGRNLHPHEIEEAARRVPGVRPGGVAAFGVKDENHGTEAVIVVVESRETDREAIAAAVRQQILEGLGFAPEAIVVVGPGCVPRTSSGKVRRSACRELYQAGRLEALRPPSWWQAARLMAGGAVASVATGLRTAWGVYCWGVIGTAAMVPIIAAVAGMEQQRVMALAGKCATALLRATGLYPQIRGEALPDGPAVFVANHKSWIDGILMTAFLPAPLLIVTTRTVLEHPVSRIIVPKLPVLIVSPNGDAAENVSVVGTMADVLRRGGRILIFPEGYSPAPGLKPFALGAFRAAAEANVPVVPIAIIGAPNVLPHGSYLPRPGRLAVAVCPHIRAASPRFDDVVLAADTARGALADALGIRI